MGTCRRTPEKDRILSQDLSPDLDVPEVDSGALLGVAEACAETGLSARTVRYWEELGLLGEVRRQAAGRRVYGEHELERLRFVQRLKTLGLSLAEIKELNAVYAIAGSTRAMLERLEQLLDGHMRHVDGRIDELVTLRDEMKRYRVHIKRRVSDVAIDPSDQGEEDE
jgi:DNA-binding transcriptional MerR regulator